jgi:hypothetical protein
MINLMNECVLQMRIVSVCVLYILLRLGRKPQESDYADLVINDKVGNLSIFRIIKAFNTPSSGSGTWT